MDFARIREQLQETGAAIEAAHELGRSLDAKTAFALATLLWDIEASIAEVIETLDDEEVVAGLEQLLERLAAPRPRPPASPVTFRRCAHFRAGFPRRPRRPCAQCRHRPSG